MVNKSTLMLLLALTVDKLINKRTKVVLEHVEGGAKSSGFLKPRHEGSGSFGSCRLQHWDLGLFPNTYTHSHLTH